MSNFENVPAQRDVFGDLLFKFFGVWLIFRGLVALLILFFAPFSVRVALLAAADCLLIFGGTGIFRNRMWGFWVSGIGIFLSLAYDLLSSEPDVVLDFVYVFMLVALAGRER